MNAPYRCHRGQQHDIDQTDQRRAAEDRAARHQLAVGGVVQQVTDVAVELGPYTHAAEHEIQERDGDHPHEERRHRQHQRHLEHAPRVDSADLHAGPHRPAGAGAHLHTARCRRAGGPRRGAPGSPLARSAGGLARAGRGVGPDRSGSSLRIASLPGRHLGSVRGGAVASALRGRCVLDDDPEMNRLILSSMPEFACGPDVSVRRGAAPGCCWGRASAPRCHAGASPVPDSGVDVETGAPPGEREAPASDRVAVARLVR